jgi:hypothetical protein
MNEKPHVRICTPSYDGKITIGFLECIIGMYSDKRYATSLNFVAGDSLVTRARNYLISDFYRDNDFLKETHLLWLDGDVAIDKDSLYSMISRDVDVVAAPVPLKIGMSDQGQIQTILNVYEEIKPYFYKAEYAATGAFLMSRNAVNLIIEYCKENNKFYEYNKQTVYDVFGVGVYQNHYLGEDYFLCKMLTDLGITIHIDSNTKILHVDTPRLAWTREPMLLSENILNKSFVPLEKNLLSSRWTTNDRKYN